MKRKLNTNLFGEIEIEENDIITFADGLPGFEEEKEFVIILNSDEEIPINYLQSAKTDSLMFLIVNPLEIYEDYDFEIPEALVDKLHIQHRNQLVVYTMLSIPENVDKMTTNLSAPIIVNMETKEGKQIILEDDRYTTKCYLFNQEKGED